MCGSLVVKKSIFAYLCLIQQLSNWKGCILSYMYKRWKYVEVFPSGRLIFYYLQKWVSFKWQNAWILSVVKL